MSCLLIPRTRVCVLWDICQWQRTYALSKGIFFRNVHFYFNGLPQYFSLINTVYAHWWIIQSRTSNRCQRIQNAFPWIIYYFQKSSRFIEQVIGNTDVDQGLSAGNKVYYCFLFCACYKPGLHYKRDFSWCRWAGVIYSSWVLTGELDPCLVFRLSMDDNTWMGMCPTI